MNSILIKSLGSIDYQECWQAMRQFTEQRRPSTQDELWLVQHPKVFTLGQAGKHEHILNAHNIPVISTDRGGQVTYHAPGQIIIYTLIDIERLGFGSRMLVSALERALINALAEFKIKAFAKANAPGVYVSSSTHLPSSPNASVSLGKEAPSLALDLAQDYKIASLGLRIRKGRSYHGLSLNFNMDLRPFSYINPCGYEGQLITQVHDLNPEPTQDTIEHVLLTELCRELNSVADLKA